MLLSQPLSICFEWWLELERVMGMSHAYWYQCPAKRCCTDPPRAELQVVGDLCAAQLVCRPRAGAILETHRLLSCISSVFFTSPYLSFRLSLMYSTTQHRCIAWLQNSSWAAINARIGKIARVSFFLRLLFVLRWSFNPRSIADRASTVECSPWNETWDVHLGFHRTSQCFLPPRSNYCRLQNGWHISEFQDSSKKSDNNLIKWW